LYPFCSTVKFHLVNDFIGILPTFPAYTVNALPYIQVPSISMLAPPIDQYLVVSQLKPYMPIKLRRYIIDPSLFQPFQNVCVQVIIIGDPGAGVRTSWVFGFVAPNTEGANAKFDMGFFRFYSLR